jgi:O-antigen/teichoic acid export membrane protein
VTLLPGIHQAWGVDQMDWRSLAVPARFLRLNKVSPHTLVARNSVWLLLARVVAQLQLLALTVLVARRLGEAGFGQYTLIASLLVLGNVFTTFGTDTLLIRQVAGSRRAGGSELSAALALQVLLSLLFVTGVWLWTAAAPQRSAEFVSALRVYSLTLFPLALFSVTTAALRGFERMDLYLVAGLASAGAQLIAVWLALRLGGGLLALTSVLLGVQAVTTAFTYWLCRASLPGFSPGWRTTSQALAQILRAAWPLALLSVMGVAYQRLGIFMLSSLSSDAATGLFSAASRVVEAFKLGHIAVLGALLPALSALRGSAGRQAGGEAQAKRLFRRAAWGLLGLGVAGAAAIALLSGVLLDLLYGPGYRVAGPALRTLAWMLAPYSLSAALSVGLVTLKKEKLVTAALALSLGAGVVFNLLWVPAYGLQGACLAALAAESLQAAILGLLYWRTKDSGTEIMGEWSQTDTQ